VPCSVAAENSRCFPARAGKRGGRSAHIPPRSHRAGERVRAVFVPLGAVLAAAPRAPERCHPGSSCGGHARRRRSAAGASRLHVARGAFSAHRF
jgi:hypothetical protein